MLLIYIEKLLILISGMTGCVPISVFASLVGITIGIQSSAVVLKFCGTTVVIKNRSKNRKF